MNRFQALAWAAVLSLALMAAACGDSEPAAQPATPMPPSPAHTPAPRPTATPSPPQVLQLPATALPAAPPKAPLTVAPLPAATARRARPVAGAAPAPQSIFPFTVTDSNGNEVTFDRPPERIVAYDSAAVEILFAMGEGQRVVATHIFVTYPPEVADVPKVGDAFEMNVEAVVALDPDLVFVFFPTFLEKLENVGLKVLFIETLSHDFTRIGDTIEMWGRITGNPSAAAGLAAEFSSRVERIRGVMAAQPDGPSIFDDLGLFWTTGPDTLEGEVFDLLKLQNIAEDISGYAQLSAEQIVEGNPDIILTPDREAYFDNPAFKDVAAVKNNMVLELEGDPLSVSGTRFVDGIEQLAKIAYPDLFQ